MTRPRCIAAGIGIGAYLATVAPAWAPAIIAVAVIVIGAALVIDDLYPPTADDEFARRHRVNPRHPSQHQDND